MVTKTLVIFANSKKMGGHCIAGREVIDGHLGGWIRPISNRDTHAISPHEHAYVGGGAAQVLDMADIEFTSAKPHGCHSEDWEINHAHQWRKVGAVNWANVVTYAEQPATLWRNGSSTYNGSNDQMLEATAATYPTSICLIRVQALTLHVHVPGARFGDHRKRIQGRFSYNGTQHWLSVTDIAVEAQYRASGLGDYNIGEACLTISLAEPHPKDDGTRWQYKLIAAVITP